MANYLPLPTPDEIPAGLRGLIALLLRAQEQQRQYGATPLSQSMWPDARLQYVGQPSPGLFWGGALRYNPGQQPDARVGVAYQKRF